MVNLKHCAIMYKILFGGLQSLALLGQKDTVMEKTRVGTFSTFKILNHPTEPLNKSIDLLKISLNQ